MRTRTLPRSTDLITSGPKAGRLRCCIMGCGRTFKDEGHNETMCMKHWRLADKRLLARARKIERFAKRRGWSDRALALHHTIWLQIRDQAQSRSLGL